MPRPGIEALVEEAARIADGCGLLLFEAPTGYGKTSATPLVYESTVEGGLAARLIHSLPLRAIVEQAYVRYRSELEGRAVVGYQAHGLGLEGKAPFYSSDLVVSSLDSLAMALARYSLGEPGRIGHYEVPRSHILSSLVVLDEAHLPLQPEPEWARQAPRAPSVMAGIMYALASAGVPVVVETATLPPSYREFLAGRYTTRCGRVRRLIVAPRSGGPDTVPDSGFYSAVEQTRWTYTSMPDPVEWVKDAVGEGLSVFVASTTVGGAIRLYNDLSEELDGVALLHGRMTLRDRSRVIKSLEEGRVKVLVGTRVVEAGVDMDFDALASDVPMAREDGGTRIAWESLIQRMGRVCRKPGRCSEARVLLYGPDSQSAARLLDGVNPRIPGSYEKLLRGIQAPATDSGLLNDYLTLVSSPIWGSEVEHLRARLCNPLRPGILIPAIPLSGSDPTEGDSLLETALARLEAEDYLTIDSATALRSSQRSTGSWLHTIGDKVAVLASRLREAYGHPSSMDPEIALVGMGELARALSMCTPTLPGGLSIAALIIKPGAYKPGVGLQ